MDALEKRISEEFDSLKFRSGSVIPEDNRVAEILNDWVAEYKKHVKTLLLSSLKLAYNEGVEAAIKVADNNFEINIETYLPLVKAWKGGFDVPFDNGYAACRSLTLERLNKLKR